ncbi:flagellar protein FliT [Amphibacillus cookii]|uniref:flagellar protein FliT n=1 Tax=Amphibacillus cookii TaxID=767787 RepID=UPI00195ABB2A|nr:flagellar protein FliT [Amphibacillus cookii]MBM7541602.1 flagellar protein FliT [Amphibacillus cookii]
MKALTDLKGVTEALAALIEQPVSAKNRDQVLLEVQEKLDRREQLLKAIQPPYTKEEQQLGIDIMEQDKAIQLRLNHLFLELKSDIRNNKKKTTSTKQYLDPYRNVATNDGSYWDKKK